MSFEGIGCGQEVVSTHCMIISECSCACVLVCLCLRVRVSVLVAFDVKVRLLHVLYVRTCFDISPLGPLVDLYWPMTVIHLHVCTALVLFPSEWREHHQMKSSHGERQMMLMQR